MFKNLLYKLNFLTALIFLAAIFCLFHPGHASADDGWIRFSSNNASNKQSIYAGDSMYVSVDWYAVCNDNNCGGPDSMNRVINWGDGTSTAGVYVYARHQYSTPGIYTISGFFDWRCYFMTWDFCTGSYHPYHNVTPNNITVTVKPRPPAPQPITDLTLDKQCYGGATNGGEQLNFTWTKVLAEGSYYILERRSPGSVVWEPIAYSYNPGSLLSTAQDLTYDLDKDGIFESISYVCEGQDGCQYGVKNYHTIIPGDYTYRVEAKNITDNSLSNEISTQLNYCFKDFTLTGPDEGFIGDELAFTFRAHDNSGQLTGGSWFLEGNVLIKTIVSGTPYDFTDVLPYTFYEPGDHKICFWANPYAPYSGSPCHTVNIKTKAGIIGDVYAKGNINLEDSRIYLDPNSVFSAGGNINIVDNGNTMKKIPNYISKNLSSWVLIKAKMLKTIQMAKAEKAVTVNSAVIPKDINWYLNNNGDNPTVSPLSNNYPDGKIWLINGDTDFSKINFSGKGTIIINGTLTISGSLTAEPNSSLGIIANNIIVKPNAGDIYGLYFSENAITFE